MTYKDPDSGIQVNLPAETRYVEPTFDNVGDYHGLTMNEIPPLDKGATGIRAFNGDGIGGLGNYKAVVSVAQDARGGIQAADSLKIDVTVTPPNGDAITLTGYRFRYAPRAIP